MKTRSGKHPILSDLPGNDEQERWGAPAYSVVVQPSLATTIPYLSRHESGSGNPTPEPRSFIGVQADIVGLVTTLRFTPDSTREATWSSDIVSVDSSTEPGQIDYLPKSSAENVEAMVADNIRSTYALPTDPLLSSQWHLGNTGGLLDLRV